MDVDAFGVDLDDIGDEDFQRRDADGELAGERDAEVTGEQAEDIDAEIEGGEQTDEIGGDAALLLRSATRRRSRGSVRSRVARTPCAVRRS